jgi:DNA repair exonuclease SbcCD ATPase subunit
LNTVYKNFEAAKAAEQKTAANLHTVNTKVEALERELEQSRILQEQLQQRCSDLEQEHGHTLAHKQDAYEKLRSRMSRRLKEEVELLDTGLGALRREPPKVHVMKDHAERAIDGLKKELENLRDGK